MCDLRSVTDFLESIPICCAIVVFVYLHRRNKKKQAIEDANDPHKSLDFGVEFTGGASKTNKRGMLGRKGQVPDMRIDDLGPDPMRPSNKRGLSMDMMGSPYLLPAGLQGSRESLHSMSRSVQDEHDPYRPITMMRGSEEISRYPRMDNGSMYSASTVQTGNDKSNLLTNAQTMSQSFPKRGDSMSAADSAASAETPTREMHSSARSTSHSRKASLNSSTPTLPEISETGAPRKDSRKESLPPLPALPSQEATQEQAPHARTSSTSVSRPPRKSSMAAAALPAIDVGRPMSDTSYYGEDIPPPPPPKVMEPVDYSQYDQFNYDHDSTARYSGRFSIDTPAPSQQYPAQDNRLSVMGQNNRLSVMGLRPLPPDNPEENAETRANRIRSFYKEYFDSSRPNPAGFYEDWDANYLDAAMYDPETGDYAYPQAPYAQPMGRRAMTPPPGGARFGPGADHNRHFSTMSGGRAPFRGRPGQRPPPKKKLPPPKALTSLPTPHMLKDDSALLNPIDFAPPTSFRETQNGRRPDSPMGIQRPYRPAVKAYSPLAPAFDDLAPIPSPHHLRKSGTFSALDFAPPRFTGQEARNSDAGSIRSARSGISAMQLDAVRAGAYRVSRIPKEFVTSREDLSNQLRPKMNLSAPA